MVLVQLNPIATEWSMDYDIEEEYRNHDFEDGGDLLNRAAFN